MAERTLIFKTGIAVLAALAGILLLRWPRVFRVSDRRFFWEATAALAVTHLGLYALVYLALHMEVRSDVVEYFRYTGAILRGLLPYRDFYMPYAPLFPYAVTGLVRVWNSPLMIILVSITIEIAAFPLWLSVLRQLAPERQVRLATILYLASPLPLLYIALAGQNQSWVMLLLGLSLWALLRARPVWSGLALGFALCLTKFLVLLFVPILWACSRQRLRWALAFAALPLVLYGGYALVADIFHPVRTMGAHISSGNLPYVLTVVGYPLRQPRIASVTSAVGALGLLGAAALLLTIDLRRSPVRVCYAVTALVLLLVLLSKKSSPTYLLMIFPAFCLSVAGDRFSWRDMALFGLFGIVASLEQSYFYRLVFPHDLCGLLSPDPASPARSHLAGMLILDVMLLGFYVYYLLLAIRQLRQPPPGPSILA